MKKAAPKENDIYGKWKLETQLGAGGQATVWRAKYLDDRHSAPAAIKISTNNSDKAKARFKREVELLKAQNHPGIVRVRADGSQDGFPYFVMERATTTLSNVTKMDTAGTRIINDSRELLLKFFLQTCEAVAHLHGAGILHRDIKPSNVLLMLDTPDPVRAVVADLGVAAEEVDQGKLTATHETVGTPGFRAPEAVNGIHTPRSDVYSLGKTLEAILNRGAPVGMGPVALMRDGRLADRLWDALDGVLRTACAFEPAARYSDAGALAQAMPRTIFDLDYGGLNVPAPPPRASAIQLTVSERATLADVIAACPAKEDDTTTYQLREATRLNGYHFALAVRRLEDIAFTESIRTEDERGNSYTGIRPTRQALEWANNHPEDMSAALAEVGFVGRPNSEDIPF